jgi:hypothetical protein
MTFVVTHLHGEMDDDPPVESLPDLLGELDSADAEHGTVAVGAGDSGWTLSAYPDGRLLWEDVEEGDEELELTDVSREEMVRLFGLVARGDLQAVHDLPWKRRG